MLESNGEFPTADIVADRRVRNYGGEEEANHGSKKSRSGSPDSRDEVATITAPP